MTLVVIKTTQTKRFAGQAFTACFFLAAPRLSSFLATLTSLGLK
jgi:hypothetical protein